MVTKKALKRILNNWLKRCLSERPADALKGSPVKAWALDYPSPEREACFVAAGRVVQGWVLFDDTFFADSDERDIVLSSARVVAHWDAVYELSHPLEVARPDVIEKILGGKPSLHPQQRCGFRFSVPLRVKHLELWLVLQDERWLLQDIAITEENSLPSASMLKVLRGSNGWLFLDNDTNGSVDQYCGRLRLTESGIQEWQRYLIGVKAVAAQHRASMAMLVAPSKESVMGPRYHPDREGDSDPIRQLLALPESEMFVYPVPELGQLGDAAFIQTDTHWTQQGAMTATCSLAAKLGLDAEAVAALFAKDVYRERTVTGDLGNKLEPPRQCKVPILTSFSYAKHRHYDNGLPNFGRLLVLVNEAALVQETCLIFGSSSSYSMFHYLCRVFGRVVFVHSAGSLDAELVDALKPAYLVIQTNARFVVQVPSLRQPLLTTIQEKQARLSEEEQALVAKRQLLVSQDDSLIAELDLGRWVSFE